MKRASYIQPPLDDEHAKNSCHTLAINKIKETHKANMKKRFENISEGIIKQGPEMSLREIYTELYITEGESEGVNKEHEVWQVAAARAETTEGKISCNDIFKLLPGQEKHIRTVLTKGVAGIGKTVSVQKFILDWIDGVANQNIDFMFSFPFRELNLIKKDQYSLHKLLLDFYPELEELDDKVYKDCQVVLIFDGLDESRLTLDFEQKMKLSDVRQTSSLDSLITNLIQGTMFPSAHLWITSRPAAASQIPAQYIDLVTEVRGFNDPQKEEYFRKRISDEKQANRIISHIKTSKSLHIMCHIPIFCWISTTVLQQMLEHNNTQRIPNTLTEMFIHFLLVQTSRWSQYCNEHKTDNGLLTSHKGAILKLAELAYKHLLERNLMFYEEDLKECGIDIDEASVYSGMCTEIFKAESSVFHHRKVYCFVHLSIQEFLAAIHVFHSFQCLHDKMNELQFFLGRNNLPLEHFLEQVVDRALESKSGHLDLFLRFLMGISLERNHRLLPGLLTHQQNSSESIMKICTYIKELNREDISPDRCINLFHCLFEMNDHSMHEEIQAYLKSPKDFKGQLTPNHYSALAHMLLMSDDVLDEFDLKKYDTSEEGLRRLVPAVRDCRKAILAECRLTDKSCGIVASVLQTPNSLIELDLSHNDLGDSGVQVLSKGLSTPHCKLQTLRLSKCGISDEGYVCLALSLMSNPCCVKELDVSDNNPGESTKNLLAAMLEDPQSRVEALQFFDCKLTDKTCENVASVLQSPNSLIEMNLSSNNLGDSGVQLLYKGLSSPCCELQALRLAHCQLTDKSSEIVASVLKSPNSLVELDLSTNDLGDSGAQLLSKGLSSPHCKLKTLRLNNCGISDEGYVCLALALVLNPSCVKELDVSNNYPGKSARKLLSDTLEDPHCKFEEFKLPDCNLTARSCEMISTLLKLPNILIEMDLSHNDLRDSGVQLLTKGLCSQHCKLKSLRLSDCQISDEGYVCLALTLMLNPYCVKELDVSNNHPGESAQKLLSTTLTDPHCKVEALQLAGCQITENSCVLVTSILQSENTLMKLDLSDNVLGDFGVQLLCRGLSCHKCKLQTLWLSDCLISEKGCEFLASALTSNPSHLKELDLSYNHPGESGLKLLSARLKDPDCKLETLKTENVSISRARPHLLKYARKLTLDPNTAYRYLSLSESNIKVTHVREEQPCAEVLERFNYWPQVLCSEGLTGRCYWEAEWSGGWSDIGVVYKSIKRKGLKKGGNDDSKLGHNGKSWSVEFSKQYSAWHNNMQTVIPAPSSCSCRVGVYLDWPAGTVSFYSVSDDKLTHLHTFHSTFTEPLYPGFGVYNSSVSVCQIT